MIIALPKPYNYYQMILRWSSSNSQVRNNADENDPNTLDIRSLEDL